MTDVSSNDNCPYCNLGGRGAMIPDGSGEPRVERGVLYECGTTSRQQSRLCAAIEAQLAEAQEQNRMLRARCDELAANVNLICEHRESLRIERNELLAERDAMRPVVEAVAADGVFLPACKWSVTCDRVKFPVSAVRPEPCSSCRTRAAVDAYRANPARCSDEDCRAPLRDGKTNHAVGCRAEQDEVTCPDCDGTGEAEYAIPGTDHDTGMFPCASCAEQHEVTG